MLRMLPSDTSNALSGAPTVENLDLFLRYYGGFEEDDKQGVKRSGDTKKTELSLLLGRWDCAAAKDAAAASVARRRAALRERVDREETAVRIEATSVWRAVTGMGEASVWETAITLDELGGFPIIRGSALKGMTRAWAEHWCGLGEKPIFKTVFGDASDEDPKVGRKGAVEFLGGMPLGDVALELDVMTPHYTDWYQKGPEKKSGRWINTPSDWCSPTPICFIAIPAGQKFVFHLAGKHESEVMDAAEWAKQALETIGVGAKTAAGYGYFDDATIELIKSS